jgi:hypothetical protein
VYHRLQLGAMATRWWHTIGTSMCLAEQLTQLYPRTCTALIWTLSPGRWFLRQTAAVFRLADFSMQQLAWARPCTCSEARWITTLGVERCTDSKYEQEAFLLQRLLIYFCVTVFQLPTMYSHVRFGRFVGLATVLRLEICGWP